MPEEPRSSPDLAWDPIELKHRTVKVNGVFLHLAEAGSGPLVILLHGFPENWQAWNRQIPALASSGYRVIAPDLRGYNFSEKPIGIAKYRLDLLSNDISALIDHLGEKAVILMGHDWGGVIAWHLAASHPEQIAKLVIINAPHPAKYFESLWRTGQLFRSWYVFFFQLPILPEIFIRRNNFQSLRTLFATEPTRSDAFSKDQVNAYIQGFSAPGYLNAAINYYRAGFRYGVEIIKSLPAFVMAPTLVIWGEKDRYLDLHLLDDLESRVPHLTIEKIPNASHWVLAEEPETVNRSILRFLSLFGEV